MKELDETTPLVTPLPFARREAVAEEAVTILVVGADPARSALLAPDVSRAGYPVSVVLPDTEAFEAALASPPALIVLDLGDKDVATLRFVDRLRRALGALAPAVLAIVEGDETSFEQAYVYGARDVLSRPVPPSLLRVKVARHVRRRTPSTVGCYRIHRVLGRGAMGTVYLAERTAGEHGPAALVALKVLDAVPGGLDAESLARFRRECEVLRSLDAPGIPRFVQAGRDGDAFFCAMDYVPGETLARAIERGPLTNTEVARIVDEIGAALETIHAAGLVHRDVKPSNVICGQDGRLRLVDFGLARGRDDHSLTKASEVLGTVAYMAPELIRGEPLDGAADAFALGMTAFEAALGAAPLEGSTYHVASKLALGQVPRAGERLTGASRELASVLEGLLAADPRARLGLREARERVRGLREGERDEAVLR